MLEKDGDRTMCGRICIHLTFEVEASIYSKDIIPGYDLFMCDSGFFTYP